jgi:hypothetical protein
VGNLAKRLQEDETGIGALTIRSPAQHVTGELKVIRGGIKPSGG